MSGLGEKGRRLRDGGLAWGATNSGKTYSNAHHFVRRCAQRPRKHLLIGANLRLLRGEVIPLIRFVARKYKVSSTGYKIDLGQFTIGKSVVIVVAGASEGAEDRLRTYHNIDSIMAEEVAVMKESFYDMAVSRMSMPFGPVWASCNPSRPRNWVKKRLDDGRWPHDEMFLLEDNPTLTDEQRQEFENKFQGVFRLRMIQALWADPEGLVYPQWVDAKPDPEWANIPCIAGVDYGESGTSAAVYSQRKGKVSRITREFYHVGRNVGILNHAELAKKIKEAAPGPILRAWVDPSAPGMLTALVKAGVVAAPAFNKWEGYDHTNRLLADGSLEIVGDDCPNLASEIDSLVYNASMERPDPSCVDHATDAMRYMAASELVARVSYR